MDGMVDIVNITWILLYVIVQFTWTISCLSLDKLRNSSNAKDYQVDGVNSMNKSVGVHDVIVTLSENIVNVTEHPGHTIGLPRNRQFPTALVVAAVAAFVFMVTFMGLAYYFHAEQLNKRKKHFVGLWIAMRETQKNMPPPNSDEGGSTSMVNSGGERNNTSTTEQYNEKDISALVVQHMLQQGGRNKSKFIF